MIVAQLLKVWLSACFDTTIQMFKASCFECKGHVPSVSISLLGALPYQQDLEPQPCCCTQQSPQIALQQMPAPSHRSHRPKAWQHFACQYLFILIWSLKPEPWSAVLTNLLLQPLGSMLAVVDVRWHSRLLICDHGTYVPYLSASFACIRCLISLATLLAMQYILLLLSCHDLLQHCCMKQTGKLVPHVAALDNLSGSCNSAVVTITRLGFATATLSQKADCVA